jgi:peptide/nickel transport system ATP-binding protein
MEPVVLAGEPPDPTRMPAGCRFHPRCPQLASGEAAAAGVADDCRTGSLPVLPASKEHAAACFLSMARHGMLTD